MIGLIKNAETYMICQLQIRIQIWHGILFDKTIINGELVFNQIVPEIRVRYFDFYVPKYFYRVKYAGDMRYFHLL